LPLSLPIKAAPRELMISSQFLDVISSTVGQIAGPRHIPWPACGDPGGIRTFATFAEWRDFVIDLSLTAEAPEIIRTKFERAQKLIALAWIDLDLFRAMFPYLTERGDPHYVG